MSSMAPRHKPPAPPGSIWVAAGRSAAEPARPSLAKTLLSPHPSSPAPEATPRSSGLPPGPSTAPARAPAGARRVCLRRAGLPTRTLLMQHPERPSGAAGPPQEQRRADARCRGPGTQGSQTTQSGQATGHASTLHTHIRTHRGTQGHRHSQVWTHGHVSHSQGLSRAGLGQSSGADASSLPALDSAMAGSHVCCLQTLSGQPHPGNGQRGREGRPFERAPGRGLARPGLGVEGCGHPGKGQSSQQGWEGGGWLRRGAGAPEGRRHALNLEGGYRGRPHPCPPRPLRHR